MKKCLPILGLLLWSIGSSAQMSTADSVYAVAGGVLNAMRAADTVALKNCFLPEARLMNISGDSGPGERSEDLLAKFITAVGTSRPAVWDERIWNKSLRVDGPMAQVWFEYGFYLNDTLIHCGVDAIDLVRTPEGWKILQLTDTRHKAGECDRYAAGAIHKVMDAWHLAAATADEVVFFGLMQADAIYVGTDNSERWSREEMRVWSKQFFDRETAWDFRPFQRQIYVSADGKTAWFEEQLETWMGPCRGSGVLQLEADKTWKISQYVLSAALPNDVVTPYLEILKKMPVPPKIRDRG